MIQYLELLQKVLDNGIDGNDRTGVGTRSIFGEQLRFDLTKGFPAVTTKKLAWKSMASELLWFIEGSDDERRLAEIQFGTRNENKKTIWTANAQSDYWKPKAKFNGDVGKIYGVNWRKWERPAFFNASGIPENNDSTYIWSQNRSSYGLWEFPPAIDQLSNLLDGLKTDPTSRRHVLTAWNPANLDNVALPPCHMTTQFYVRNNEISCMMFQRSCDLFLGLPYNIASYALLTHMIAQVCGFIPKELIICIGDAHLYFSHFDQVNEQLQRVPYILPTLWLNSNITSIFNFTLDDIKLVDYDCHPTISAPMAV